MMDADVASHRQSFRLRGTHHGHALGGRQPARGARARRCRGPARISSPARSFPRRGESPASPRRVATSPSCATPPLREMRFLRAQPDAVAERRRVLHRAQQHPVSVSGASACENATHPASASSPISVSSSPCEADRQRADRIDVRLVERARAVLQHLDQPRLVERRIGVGRTGETRDAAGHRRRHLRLECRLVLEPRLAQPRREVDQTRARRRGRSHRSLRFALQPAGASPIAATFPRRCRASRRDRRRASGRSRGRC